MVSPVPLSADARIWQSQGVSGVKRLTRCRFFLMEKRAGARFFRAYAIFLVDFFWQVWLNVLGAGVGRS